MDGTGLEEEAAIIHWAGSKNLPLSEAERMELWELAAFCGVHLKETRADHDRREIIDRSEAYWDETSEQRSSIMAEATERRRARKQQRRKVT